MVGGVGVGRTRYTFDPINRDTLAQAGSGWSYGLQLLGTYQIIRPRIYDDFGISRFLFFPAPFVSRETYRYAPGSTELVSRSTQYQIVFGPGVLGLYVTSTLATF